MMLPNEIEDTTNDMPRAAIKESQKKPTMPYQRELRDTIYGPDWREAQARREQDEYEMRILVERGGR